MYDKMPTGLSPEIVHFNMSKNAEEDIYVKVEWVWLIKTVQLFWKWFLERVGDGLEYM